ncbi:MAG: hypothetical protein FGM15_03150 [Chthoniobacterales bacterium]|nr:hypothetical protein [Chthoniobacterales bacterium]
MKYSEMRSQYLNMKKLFVFPLIALLIRDGLHASAQNYTLYGIDVDSSKVVLIDPISSSITDVAQLPFVANYGTGFDFRPSDGKLYASTFSSNEVSFYVIEPSTGSVQQIDKKLRVPADAPPPFSIGFTSSGDLYGYGERTGQTSGDFLFGNWSQGTLTKRPNGARSPSVLGGDFDDTRQVFWASDEWDGKIYQLSASSGERVWTSTDTWSSGNSGDLLDMDVTPTGEVLVIATTSSIRKILSVDPNTGTFSEKVSLPNTRNIQRIASVPTGLDTDGDGVNNYRENKDGTDPNDPNSFNPLSKALVAYYSFDQGLVDESGYAKHLDRVGNYEFVGDLTKDVGQALRSPSRVDGGVMSSQDSGISANSDRTISFWFRSDGPQPWPTGNVVLMGSRVAVDRGRGSIQIDNGYKNVETPAVEDLHQRVHHFVWTYKNKLGESRFYLDGQPVDLVFQDGFGGPDTTLEGVADGPIKIMGGPGSEGFGDRGFQGEVDNARLYSRVMSAAEVGQLYQTEAGTLDSDGDGLTDAWERGFGRYQIVQGNFNWLEAKADAESKGGHLATITSQAEQDFVVSSFDAALREGREGTWFGAFQIDNSDEPSGNWAWVTGESWSYTSWNVAPDNYQGNQDYGCIIGDNLGFSKWDDAALAGGYTRYVLEKGYPTNPLDPDSDDDGFNDSIETQYKTDPNDATITPNNSRETGRVSAWGDNSEGSTAVPGGLSNVIQISTAKTSYALKSDGTVSAWGSIWNGSGWINVSSVLPHSLVNVVQVDAGSHGGIALKGDGTVVMWGYFWDGNEVQPVSVPEGLTGIVQVSMGMSHVTALKADGTVVVWGTNNWGETNVPSGLADIVQVSAGDYHSLALKRDGTVVAWGTRLHSVVTDVPLNLGTVAKVSAGAHFSLALKADGTIAAWGLPSVSAQVLAIPSGLTDVKDISASKVGPNVIALKADGTLVEWGDNTYGQLSAPPLSDILQVAAGSAHGLAMHNSPLDRDGDGVTDYREGRDGTDPNDPNSFHPLSVALLAHYTFDNTWNDSSGYERHVLAPYTTFGPGLRGLGSSLSLTNGNSQANYWNDPNNTNTPNRINTFSISIWMRPSTLNQTNDTWHYLFSAPNNAAYLRFGNASVGAPGSKVLAMGYEWPGDPGYSFTTEPISRLRANNWQQVVGVQDGNSTKIYLNGRLVGSSTNGSIPLDPSNYTIGNLFNTHTYQGLLDEARIYGRTLSATEVRELYSSEARDMDSDGDGLPDTRESATGEFVSTDDTGSDPYEADSSGDGISDGEAVSRNLNPLVDQRPVLDLLREVVGSNAGRFGLVTEEQKQQENNASRTNGRADVINNPAVYGLVTQEQSNANRAAGRQDVTTNPGAYGLYTADSIMDLRMGGVMVQKKGSNAVVTFQPQTTVDLTQPFTNNGTAITNMIPMPGNKGFIRIHAK